MSLRDARREATRRAIADAARDLLEEGGADALTFRAIADRVGVSVGTVVNHAGSKAQLVVHLLMEEITTAIDKRAPTDPKAPLIEQLVDRFTPFLEQYAARPSLARRTIMEVTFAPDDAYAPYLALTLDFVAELAGWLEASGRLRPYVMPMVAARTLFDAYLGVVILFLRTDPPVVEVGRSALRGSFEGLMPVLFEPLPEG